MKRPDLENDFAMNDLEFRKFQEMIAGVCGLYFGEDLKYVLERRVARRVRELNVASIGAYHQFILSKGPGERELDQLIDDLTTNETYFFRERRQLTALVEEILPERVACSKRRGPVRILSAGCSSGEEPYSIVMLAQQAGFQAGSDFTVYAADICRPMLHKARKGVYRTNSLREMPPEFLARFFSEHDGLYSISEEIKSAVHFIHLNFLDEERMALLGRADVILCRNVIIYFSRETKKRVINTLYHKLQAGGYLLLGHAESLLNISTEFRLCHLKNDLVYCRPVPGEGICDSMDLASRAVIFDGEKDWNES